MKASICIEMIFTEMPFLDRIRAAADVGYDAVEFWTWEDKELPAIRDAAVRAGIEISAFQSNRGGTLINPEHRPRFLQGIQESLTRANAMGVRSLFLLTDELGPDRSVLHRFPGLSEEAKRQSVLEGLKMLAPLAEKAGVTLNLEPLNTLVDHPGYWLNHSRPGLELVLSVNSPSVRLLFDIYHMQVMEGNLIETLTANVKAIGHVHVADVPGRHEPGSGEINFARVFEALNRAGYEGYVGMEFSPTGNARKAATEALALLKP
ncbi:MAG: TIM barrel protein [Anaerolineales bacterium]|jgi:hydroxypyruvate isomerase